MKKTKKINKILIDLYKIRNPHISKEPNNSELEKLQAKVVSASVKEQSPIPGISRKAYLDLVTGRNRNLIFPDEQKKLTESVISFFGMSVGSIAVRSWMLLARANTVKIIDPDVVDATNLNRLESSWDDIGRKKIDVVSEKLKLINPYAEVIKSDKVGEKAVREAVTSRPRVNAIVDEIDDIEGKILLRKYAKLNQIPLISAADVGDNVILDIERYDQDTKLELFLGRLGNIEKIDLNKLTVNEKKELIIKLVGFKHNSQKMLQSLLAIKGSISTWPQLGSTATIAGGIVANTLKKILLNESVKSGRYFFPLDEILVFDYSSQLNIKKRKSSIDEINNQLNQYDT